MYLIKNLSPIMKRHHVIQVSDLHLSEIRAYNQHGWESCLSYIAHENPDIVVSTGDHALDDPDCLEDHIFARSQLDRITVPWSAVPGNHDIGDLNPNPYQGQHVNHERIERYLGVFGTDRWTRELGTWRLIGLNAFLLGSNVQREEEQYDWLREIVSRDRTRPLAIFLHKPLCVERLDEDSSPNICVVPEGRSRLLAALGDANLRLIASGHNHHYRSFVIGSIAMVWAPSTAQILRMPRSFRALLKPGVVHYWLDDAGGIEFTLAEPPGIVPNDITDLLARYGAMRTVPHLPLESLGEDAGRLLMA
ncbi:phosphohydrolase [Mesorhizobium tianshanense]|uniref:Calcineurin-like phosphoesterase family protein n=1 Tax=Mesorhizobium tianshanense TaxID=39844 RepID=A0A562MGZ6_9HYPH|nr:metallophosphoesterase [Mesorhizobium tianshanense]TWI19174.1 calcineurin-like phosphoesterase family protein [Mesorhizobium tianshanense]GLS36558.1 phosphohydrolase [Mesorhizobium tianshanense]